jgi:hypothetical protein
MNKLGQKKSRMTPGSMGYMKTTLPTIEEARVFAQSLLDQQKYVIDIFQHPGETGFEVQWIELRDYLAHDGKSYPDEVWMTEKGEMKLIQDLEPEHARNIIRMVLRNERALKVATEELMKSIQNGEFNVEDETLEIPAVTQPRVLH